MNIQKLGLMVAAAMLVMTASAKADYIVWTDIHTGARVSYPDTWKTINNQQPDDIITLSIPSGEDNASCRLRANEDRRFVIYPNRYRDEVRDTNFTNDFWTDYTASYDNVNVIRQQNEAGLGQGYASMTLISFVTPPDEPYADKAGLMLVTNYGDKVYVAECTSTSMSYRQYHTAFLSFFKTISFKPAYSVTKVGDYRNFLKDWGTINVPLSNTVSRSVY
ncbi:MAG TPA: hypothetical protein PLE43_05485 [Alphaproteobacteria bacterium]|nr:hypothetical protein [Alphaproteobacteria bacterium]